jgi:radical SAM protein with 4Fe4S-binding SPASM domain
MSEPLLTEQIMNKPMMNDLDIIRTDKIREITIHVTQFCNLRCKGCYAHVENEELAQKLEVSDLEWINRTFNPDKTLLLGGEPLAYPYLEDALKIFKHVTLSTNGFYVKDRMDLLVRNKVTLQLSIEGRQKYNDYIRGKGVYEKVIEAGILAKQEGLKCYFRMGYCENNLRDIDWLLKNLSAKHEIPLVLLPRLDQPPMSIDKQIYLFDLITSAGNDSLVDMPHFFQYLGKRGRCLAGSERLNFNYDGRITPCQFDWNYMIGRIGQPIEVINKSREMYINTCKFIKRECINCSRADICKGGCRMTNAHLGCPLKADFNINSYIEMHGTGDVGSLVDKIDRLVSLVKDAEIC